MLTWSRMVEEILDNREGNGRGARSGPVGVRREAGLRDRGACCVEEQSCKEKHVVQSWLFSVRRQKHGELGYV